MPAVDLEAVQRRSSRLKHVFFASRPNIALTSASSAIALCDAAMRKFWRPRAPPPPIVAAPEVELQPVRVQRAKITVVRVYHLAAAWSRREDDDQVRRLLSQRELCSESDDDDRIALVSYRQERSDEDDFTYDAAALAGVIKAAQANGVTSSTPFRRRQRISS